ncbi:MAG: site-specific integrase [Candidatus Tectomicrobia bacterium]|nr:site-specific integrase [Candidatus Tectomicrobia bacterium]
MAADQLGARQFIGPEQERILVSELFQALRQHYELQGGKGAAQFRSHLRAIEDSFGQRRVVDVTAEDVDRYILQRLEAGRKPATINRETQLLGQAFKLAMERGRVSSCPRIRRLPERNARQGYFEHAELEPVVRELPAYLRDFTRFAYLTGWRKGEIASLTWSDIDRGGRVAHLKPEASKNERGRTLSLEGDLWELIERCWAARRVKAGKTTFLAEYVFHCDGRMIREFRKSWRNACREAGVPGKLFHDLRRTAVRNMVRAGVPETVAMAVSGHRTRSVFDRYDITNERDLRDAMRRMQNYLRGQNSDNFRTIHEKMGHGEAATH